MATIAIFDSGVGGLSIYTEVVLQSPEHDYVFVSDNQAFPYGTKEESELSRRVIEVTSVLVKKYTPDILVIACNTASTVTLPALRERYQLPVVGVVPAIKPAAKLSQSKVIAMLATPATIKRAYTNKLINEFASDCEVIRLGSSELVNLAETKLRGQDVDMDSLEQILQPLLALKQIDILVLACTHFPLLYKEISMIFDLNNHPIQLIDSSAAIAQRVSGLLAPESRLSNSLTTSSLESSSRQASNLNTQTGNSIAVFTQTMSDAELLNSLARLGIHKIQTLQLS